MITTSHPPADALLLFATGETDAPPSAADSTTGLHVEGCVPCQRRLVELRSFLNAVRDELLATRPECPSPDELALLPPGAEHDDPHLRQCPLCREEVRMLFEVESAGRLGTEVGELAASGLFYRPSPVVHGGDFAYQRGVESAEWVIAQGEEKNLMVAGTAVRLRCVGRELVVDVGEMVEPLSLVLSNDLLEKQLPLAAGEQRVSVGRWQRLRVVPRG